MQEIMLAEAEQVKICHEKIGLCFKTALESAREAGKTLNNVKARISGYGNWVKENCEISLRTANNYTDIYNYWNEVEKRNSIADFSSMNTIYKEIEQIKQDEKKTELQKANERIVLFKKTGKKPEGWRLHTDDKLLEEKEKEEAEYEKRKKEAFESQKKRVEDKKRADEENARSEQRTREEVNKIIGDLQAKETWRQRLMASKNCTDKLSEILLDYLSGLGSDHERLVACTEGIKVLRAASVELQRAGA